MNPRQRVFEAIAHRPTDHIPLTLYLAKPIHEKLLSMWGPRNNWPCPPDDTIRILWPIEYSDITEQGWKDMFGCEWMRHDEGGCIMINPPLQEPDAHLIHHIDILPDSEVKRIMDIRIDNPDKFIYYQFTSAFSERLWSLRGLEQSLMDYLLYPEFVHEALDILMEMILKALDKLLTLPIDGVTFGDDFGTQKGLMLSRKIFLEFHKPRLAKMYEKVRNAGRIVGQHSCGDNTEIMGDFADIGLQVFHPLQPEAMDIVLIKKRFGSDLTFRGGISTQRMPFVTPWQVRQDVSQAVEILNRGGGYLMETSKPLLQETPVENVIAVIETMVKSAGYNY